jgi:putative Mg2+ transporter-C (MgtC) family protein
MENLSEDIIKLLVALAMGAVIGTEREYRTKAAGFRTVILIMVGSTLFTIISGIMGGHNDPARVASNIVTGIGFIGAGAIFKEGTFVKGLTTAAVIWISAAIGMSIGIGQYEFAFISLVIVMAVLLGFTWFQNIIDKSNVNKAYKITMIGNNIKKMDELNTLIAGFKLNARCVAQVKRSDVMELTYSIQGPEKKHDDLTKEFYSNSLVHTFES